MQSSKLQLSKTMKENVIESFIDVCITPKIEIIKSNLSSNRVVFFYLMYNIAFTDTDTFFDNVTSLFNVKDNKETDDLAYFLINLNKFFVCKDFNILKSGEMYKDLLKIQPPKNKEEEKFLITEIQKIIIPQFTNAIEGMDMGGIYYNHLKNKGKLTCDYKSTQNNLVIAI